MQQLTKRSRPWFLAQLAIATAILLPYSAQADAPLAIQRQNAAGANNRRLAAPVVQPNLDCTLIVPPNPLTAKGLATPYQLVARNGQGACHEANKEQSAFVEAAVFDRATGQISIYNPLVVDAGMNPAVPPVQPNLPRRAIVALWFGYNGGNLTLEPTPGDTLSASGCVNGEPGGDVFGQFAYCNAPSFFRAAQRAIRNGQLQVPSLGSYSAYKNGKRIDQACPTVRDFSIVDQDQSDNLLTSYLVTEDGKLAQDTEANRALPNATPLTNPSDERLLSVSINGALKCKSWKAKSLTDPSKREVSALALNELQARAYQERPVAKVPAGDPFVLTGGEINLDKLNAYRLGVAQRTVSSLDQADTARYCRRLFRIQPNFLDQNQSTFSKAPSPNPVVADSLFTFLAQRFVGTDKILGCSGPLGLVNPVTVQFDNNGIAIGAKINLPEDARNQAKLAATAVADDQEAAVEQAAETAAAAADANAAAADPQPVNDPNAVTPSAPATTPAPVDPNAGTPADSTGTSPATTGIPADSTGIPPAGQ
ncbi:MAG: hypothetical protein WCA35_22385 [Kovacikia sp.]